MITPGQTGPIGAQAGKKVAPIIPPRDVSPPEPEVEAPIGIPTKPPTANPYHVDRAAWNPPRRQYKTPFGSTGKELQYVGHYRPADFLPNYGENLQREVEKAQAYMATHLPNAGEPGQPYPLIEHNNLQRPVPIYRGADHMARTNARYEREPDFQETALAGSAPGVVMSPGGAHRMEPWAVSEIAKQNMMSPAGISGGMNNPADPDTVAHEMAHVATLSARDRSEPSQQVWNATVPGTSLSLRGLRHANPGVDHGLGYAEQMGWLSGLQHELYGQTGKRLESPEEAKAFLQRMIDLPEAEFEAEVGKFKSKDVPRGMRHLRKLREPVNMEPLSENLGDLDEETLNRERREAYRYLGMPGSPIQDSEIPAMQERLKGLENEQNRRMYSPEDHEAALPAYLEWLSKLAPALVSTQNGNQNIMKTAHCEPQDMSKEANIGELLSGLGGQATNFINNMPNNPMWQNGLAGGGSAAFLMLLLNLLTGNSMGRGLLPATLAGGALGAGMPYLYNHLNRPRGSDQVQIQGPPKPIPEAGPPAPNQTIDATGQFQTATPSQRRQWERQQKVIPGTVGEMVTDFTNKADQTLWNVGGPVRGLSSRIDETKKNADKVGWLDSLMMTPMKGAFKDPYANAAN